jgi:DNA-binding FrmR family transcriptional regulator
VTTATVPRVLDAPKQKEMRDRLARIEGHVRAIGRMVEEGRPCEDVLVQVGAVRAALRSLTGRILECHMEHCIGGLTDLDARDAALAELRTIIKRAGLIEGN